MDKNLRPWIQGYNAAVKNKSPSLLPTEEGLLYGYDDYHDPAVKGYRQAVLDKLIAHKLASSIITHNLGVLK